MTTDIAPHVADFIECRLRLLGAELSGDLGNPTRALSRAWARHHTPLDGEALLRAVVEKVTDLTHAGCTDREREGVVASRIDARLTQLLVATTADMLRGPVDGMATVYDLDAHRPGLEGAIARHPAGRNLPKDTA